LIKSVLRLIVEFVAAFALVLALLNQASNAASWQIEELSKWLVAGILAIGYVALLHYLADTRDGEKSLKANSKSFSKYYSSWYGQEGQIHIFCSDTEWLEHNEMRPIVSKVLEKGSRAFVYLRETGGPVTDEFRRGGVQIFEIPPSVGLNIKMSVLVNNDHKEAIIRHKLINQRSRRFERNIFKETKDAYLLGFAVDFLQSIRNGGLA
jgi:hypothetical protein